MDDTKRRRIIDISEAYVKILSRAPDPAGLRGYVDGGGSIAEVKGQLRKSTERYDLVNHCFREVLGRQGKESGLEGYALGHRDESDIKMIMMFSPEFQARALKMYENSASPTMGFVKDGIHLRGAGLIYGRLRGASHLNMLCNRRATLDGMDRAVDMLADLGFNFLRVFMCLGVQNDRDAFVHYQLDGPEFMGRFTHLLTKCRSRGVYLQIAVFDEPGRNSRERRGEGFESPRDDSLYGGEEVTQEVVRAALNETFGWLDGESKLAEAFIWETANEGGPSWISNDMHAYGFNSARMMNYQTASNTLEPPGAHGWQYLHGDLSWIHLHPHFQDGGQGPDGKHLTAPEYMAWLLTNRRDKFGQHMGYSSDGRYLVDGTMALLCAHECWGAGHSIEIMSNDPMELWDPDKEVRMGYWKNRQFVPVTWMGKTRATTRWMFEQVAKVTR